MITKTDFLRYLDAPMHLWAEKHNQMEVGLSSFDQHLLMQGKEIEILCRKFLPKFASGQGENHQLAWEQTFSDGHYQARIDAIAYDPKENVYDLYEIKSATSIQKEHKYDVTFQRLVCEVTLPVRDVFLVYVNKEFVRQGDLDVSSFFSVSNMNEEIEKLRDEVALLREEAWKVSESSSPEGIPDCLNPKVCPCPNLCHPALPEYSIFDLPRLHFKKKRELKESGILAIQQIPEDFPISDRQQLHARVVKNEKPLIDHPAIRNELEMLEYPLYFLDYETFNPGVPLYDRYKPYQHMVFQYSLHIISSKGENPEHYEYLITDEVDPSIRILEHLEKHIGDQGSVIVWNKAFEAGKNREMAERYPNYRDLLININDRIFDLMEIFSKGYFVHPDFHGSASIKKVLPVLVQSDELNYENLEIAKGDDAMMTWNAILSGEIPQEDIPQVQQDLLQYCKLDTLAMVKLWEALEKLVRAI